MSSLNDPTAGGDDRRTREFRVGLPARDAVLHLLDAVLAKGRPLDAAFSEHVRHGALAPLARRDRALARAITATALRRLGQIDALIAKFVERPLPKSAQRLRHILISALAQILFMETQAHAVVNLAVHQTKADRRTRRFDKLVNALLRRAGREGAGLIAAQDAARLNTPDWLWTRWSSAYSEAAVRQIAERHLREAALDITVKSEPELWAARLGGIALATGTVRLNHRGRIEALEGFDDGDWWIQDAAAALPARLLGEVAGKRVADLCAAPGGKTAQLATRGARVTAVDISRGRLKRLRENLARLHLEVECVAADATLWRPTEPFDAVLLDAPCLATGTIRRHPDIPHLKTMGDLEKLAALQTRLLAHAAGLLKPGGRLVYCTCSLEPEEGEGQIATLLAGRADLRLDPITPREVGDQAAWLTDQGFLRTLPHQLTGLGDNLDGIDGFFAARLIRT